MELHRLAVPGNLSLSMSGWHLVLSSVECVKFIENSLECGIIIRVPVVQKLDSYVMFCNYRSFLGDLFYLWPH
jgi:hypothetical protein